MNNPFLAHFHHAPALVNPAMHHVFESCLHQAAIVQARIDADTSQPLMADDFWLDKNDWRSQHQPYVVKDGILQIPVKGVLVNNFNYSYYGMITGYNYIQAAFNRGMDDPEVKGIALVCDTPGGHVAGNFDLVDKMFARRGEKPVRAYAAESAYSAGYSIASVADRLIVSRTGGVGSIGVVTMHIDQSKRLEDEGLKVTFIHFGKHKVDGNSTEPLPADVKKKIQARIDELGQVFVATVARNRGMDEADVRATEAATFTASEAVSNGLADDTGSLDDAIAAFAASIEDGEDEMSTNKDNLAVDQAAIDAARAEGHAAGVTEGKVAGAKDERTRICAILAHDNAKKRPKAAMSFATKTDMSVEDVAEMLADLPEEKAETAAPGGTQRSNAFKDAMDADKHPDLGQDDNGERSEEQSEIEKDMARANSALVHAGFGQRRKSA